LIKIFPPFLVLLDGASIQKAVNVIVCQVLYPAWNIIFRTGDWRELDMEREAVIKVAKVARLKLTEEEIAEFAKDMEEVFSFFSVLDEAPAAQSHDFNPVPVRDVLRLDEVARDIDVQKLLDSMDVYEGMVRGPRLA
jgi:aspartyl/glutamyl-tRNA(Asn/Gln) amidotransferase C subunit